MGIPWGEEAEDRPSFEKRRLMGMVGVSRSVVVVVLKEAWVRNLVVEDLQEARESWRGVEVLQAGLVSCLEEDLKGAVADP